MHPEKAANSFWAHSISHLKNSIHQNSHLINLSENRPIEPRKMDRILIFLLLASLALITPSTAAADSTYTYFLRCLQTRTGPAAAATILVPKSNSQYVAVLDAYLRNLRFISASTPKPLLIIAPRTAAEVSATVVCARANNTQLRIRSGGHDYEGVSYTSRLSDSGDFVLLDLFNFRQVNVDVASRTAYVQAGATLGELYFSIWNKTKTLGFPAGVCPTVGVGGHVSGGGYGNMIRSYGLSVDHVVDAEIVVADGRILDRKSMGEDLFWAIRGGGGASFGVILSFTVNLVPVPETVTVFNVQRFQSENATDLVYKWQLVMQDVDPNLFLRLLLQPVTDKTKRGAKTVRVTFIALFLGDRGTLVSTLNAAFPELGVKETDCNEMGWAESVLFWSNYPNGTPVQTLLGRNYTANYLKRKSDYVTTPIPKTGLELLWKKLVQLGKPGLVFNSYGGVMNQVPADATAFPHRAGNLYKIQYSVNWEQAGPEVEAEHIGELRELYGFMEPYVSRNPRAAFLNYRDLDIGVSRNGSYEEGKVYGEKYFVGNFERLVRVKSKVDPDNFFRYEQSIPVLG